MIVAAPPLVTALWPHQQEAIAFVERLWRADRPGAMLAMAMGAGKSRVAIELIQRNNLYPALILAPKSVVSVWPEQFARYGNPQGHFTILPLEGPLIRRAATLSQAFARARARDGQPAPIIAITNYDGAWKGSLRDTILAQRWACVIADESHRLQSPGGRQSWFAKELAKRARYRLALTGTPLSSSPLSIYAQYRFLDPSVFGTSFVRFRGRYAVMGGYGRYQVLGYQNLDDLSRRMYSIAHRADASVLDLLPPTDERLECDLEPEARRIYRELEHDFVADLERGTITVTNALTKLLRLQQIAGGSVGDDDGALRQVSSAKAGALADALDALAAAEPVVVFCRFRADLDVVHAIAAKQGRITLELSGRVNQLAEWQAGGSPVLAVQVQAGGLGVDLTRARYCIFYSLGFSLAEYEQARARLHRPGQTRHVIYVHLVVRGTVDQHLYRALAAKGDVVRAVLDGMQQ